MIDQRKARPAAAATAARADEDLQALALDHTTDAGPRETHETRLLRALLSGRALTRLQAWEELGNGAANSTVARLQQRHPLRIHRRRVRVEGRYCAASVCEYSIAPEQMDAAREALEAELAGRRRGGKGDA